jgi:hypothetical protein
VAKEGRARFRQLTLLLIALFIYLFLGNDDHHHWHEWRYLYSAANYSIEELRQGTFDPGPPPERSADEVGAWYWGQLLHESILRTAAETLDKGLRTVTAIQWLYGAWIPLAVLFGFLALRRLRLGVDETQVAALTLLSPLAVYLGFKLMAEGPAVFFAAVAIWSFAAGADKHGIPQMLLWTLAAFFTALSFLAMVYMPLLVLSFLVAWSICLGERSSVERWLGPLWVGAGSVVFSLVLAELFYGLSPADYFNMYGFYRTYVKSIAISLFGVLTAWSALYLLALAAFKSPQKKPRNFFLWWLIASCLPLFVFSGNYLEARFLAVALFPLAGLSVLGLDVIAQNVTKRLTGRAAGTLSWVCILLFVPLVSAISLPFMPFEMNASELRRVVTRVLAQDSAAAILIPWNYTDFHYLRFAFPDAPIFLVQSPVDERNHPVPDDKWVRRYLRIYGTAFLPDLKSLKNVDERNMYYVGHGILPPLRNLKSLATLIGLHAVAYQIDKMNPKNHLAESWMWNNPKFLFREEMRDGNYRLYRVRLHPPPPS